MVYKIQAYALLPFAVVLYSTFYSASTIYNYYYYYWYWYWYYYYRISAVIAKTASSSSSTVLFQFLLSVVCRRTTKTQKTLTLQATLH